MNSGDTVTGSHNLVEDGSDGLPDTITGDPNLGPLGANGGPTQTHALLAGSLAIDAGSNALTLDGNGDPLTTDQRGLPFARVFGGTVDIGAYEAQSLNLVVDITADENDGNYTPGDVSLREAVALSNANPGADTITFDTAGVFATPQTITLTLGELPITDAVTITGTGAANLSISGDNASRIFYVDDGAGALIDVEIVAVTLSHGHVHDGVGGAIINIENLTMADAVITDNSAYNVGGGIFNGSSAIATLTNCTLSGNVGSYNGGGGIFNNGGTVTLTNCTLSSNSGYDGGGIYTFGGTVMLTNSTLSGNSGYHGGGIFNYYGTVTLTNSTLSGNSATYGGGIFNQGSATLTNCNLSRNSADGTGGAISNTGTVSLTNSTLSGNSAGNSGGGIYNDSATATLTNCTLSGNSAGGGSGEGGGIFVYFGDLVMNNTIVANSLGLDVVNKNLFGSVSGSHNLVEDGRYTDGLSDTITGDPNLGPLGNNGGPTQTHALLLGSPAINAGSDALVVDNNGDPLTTDQRGAGYPRFVNTVDIGAFEIESAGAQLITDPCDPTKTALLVTGTSGNDIIQLKRGKESSKIQVLINNVSYGIFKPTGNLIFSGQAGNDRITVDSKISRRSFLYGNAGNDSLTSGSLASILVGGDGNDTLTGGNARDILIGGSTRFDELNTANQQALCAIQKEWLRTDVTYTSRVNHLRGSTPGGLNGTFLLTAAPGPSRTVFDDASIDKLTGGSDRDWYFANKVGGTAIDQVFGKLSTELLEEV